MANGDSEIRFAADVTAKTWEATMRLGADMTAKIYKASPPYPLKNFASVMSRADERAWSMGRNTTTTETALFDDATHAVQARRSVNGV